MKKLVASILCLILAFSMSACYYSESEQEEIISMFDSFDNNKNFALLTYFELVVGDNHYDVNELKYDGKICNIVYLDKDGFYSVTFDSDTEVNFLFTSYDDLEPVLLGEETLPSHISRNYVFFVDRCFGIKLRVGETEEPDSINYFWNVDTHEITVEESQDETNRMYNRSIDNNRSKDYSYKVPNGSNHYIEITHNETGVTKRIDASVLNTFEEGKKIKKAYGLLSLFFGADNVYEQNGDIYFVSYFEVGFLGDPSYYYITKWNFETEEAEIFTSVYFETFPEGVIDMCII